MNWQVEKPFVNVRSMKSSQMNQNATIQRVCRVTVEIDKVSTLTSKAIKPRTIYIMIDGRVVTPRDLTALEKQTLYDDLCLEEQLRKRTSFKQTIPKRHWTNAPKWMHLFGMCLQCLVCKHLQMVNRRPTKIDIQKFGRIAKRWASNNV